MIIIMITNHMYMIIIIIMIYDHHLLIIITTMRFSVKITKPVQTGAKIMRRNSQSLEDVIAKKVGAKIKEQSQKNFCLTHYSHCETKSLCGPS